MSLLRLDSICAYPELVGTSAEQLLQRYGAQRRVRVCAEVHDDLRQLEVQFDAAPWFARASEDEIRALRGIGWGGNYEADDVARFFEDRHPEIGALMLFCRTACRVGFECHIDENRAMQWLRLHRPQLWAQFVRNDEDLRGWIIETRDFEKPHPMTTAIRVMDQ